MARNKLDIDVVREIAMAFKGVQESTTYGVPSFKVGRKLMACPAINKSAEPNSLGVFVGFDQRNELLTADPNVYYLTESLLESSSNLINGQSPNNARLNAESYRWLSSATRS